jgi:hypothetical protein
MRVDDLVNALSGDQCDLQQIFASVRSPKKKEHVVNVAENSLSTANP